MSAALAGWDEARRRGFRKAFAFSALFHAAIVAFFVIQPGFPKRRIELPSVVTVELVAAAPAPAPRPAPKPAPAPKAAPAPAPAPKPVPRKVVLPTRPTRKVEPREIAKPPPKPAEAEYDDLLESLRADAGEARPDPIEMVRRRTTPPPTPAPRAPARPQPKAVPAPQASGPGRPAPPEVVAWLRDARIHVRREWVLEAGFRREPLETHVEVTLDSGGHVQGEPKITRRSGNPWYDESVVRAIEKSSPLPAPPEAGKWPFVFRPEDD